MFYANPELAFKESKVSYIDRQNWLVSPITAYSEISQVVVMQITSVNSKAML